MSVYTAPDYRAFVRKKIKENEGIRGYQGRLAKAAGCQPSYLSQILNSHLEMTPDQAAGLAAFWGLDDDETEAFMTLVMLARAAGKPLKRQLARKLERLRARRRDLAQRLERAEKVPSVEAQATYYSSWYWAAIHVMLAVPGLADPQRLADRLGLPAAQVAQALVRLEELGLVARGPKGWVVTKADLHLPRSSPLTEVNHASWRHRALTDVQRGGTDSSHYTAVFAMRPRDAERVQQDILSAIVASREVIKESPAEDVYCCTWDFFRV